MGDVVVVTDRPLLPLVSGNRLRILGLLDALRGLERRVVLLCANPGPVAALRPRVDELVAISARSFPGGPLAAFDPTPFRRALERVVDKRRPQVVIAEYAWLAPALRTLPAGVQRWVDCHDVLHERCARFQRAGLDPWTVCTAAEERALLADAHVLITCQESDADVLRRLVVGPRVACAFTPAEVPDGFEPVSAGGHTVLAVGARHPGNEAIRDFAREAWPRVRARVPEARFRIVGTVGDGLGTLPGVDAVGPLADLLPHYVAAAVVVCPVAVGSGVKTKMLEALRLGKAVVVTPAAEEGLPRPEPPAWVTASSLPACADAVADLLADPDARARLERRAYTYGEQYASSQAFRDSIRALLPVESAGPPSVSIVVLHSGSARGLRACLRALTDQQGAAAIREIVVVDPLAGRQAPDVARAFPLARAVPAPAPSAAAACNHGAELVSGEVIAFLESDWRPSRNWLQAALASLRVDGTPSVVNCPVAPVLRPSGVAGVRWYEALLSQERRAGPSALGPGPQALLVRRTVWRAVGRFAEDRDASSSYAEWLATAMRRGIDIVLATDARVVQPLAATRSELRAQTHRRLQAEWAVAGTGPSPPVTIRAALGAATARVARELALAFQRPLVPRRFRLNVAMTAIAVWWWSVTAIGARRRNALPSARETTPPASPSRPLTVASVSVIIPSAGWSPSLEACVESVRAQALDIPLEIVVVINGAEAGGPRPEWPDVVLVHEPRPGPAAARNAGVLASTGDVLAFIDSDCTASPRWLAAALLTLRRDAGGSIVAGAITRSGAARNWVSLYDSVTYLQQKRYVHSSRNCVTANLVVHRSVFRWVGAFDETFDEAAFEDWDWSRRARAAGLSLVYEADAAVDHPCMSSIGELRRKAARLGRGEVVFGRKTGEPIRSLRLLPTLRGQIRRASRCPGRTTADRLRLMCVATAAGFWTWRAARVQWRRSQG